MTHFLLVLVALTPVLQSVSLGPAFGGATAADLLAVTVLANLVVGRGRQLRGDWWGAAAVILTATWVMASGSWGASAGYAFTKGLAVAGWGGVALLLSRTPIPTSRVLRAWMVGVGLVVAASLGLALLNPDAALYRGGASIGGMPRLRGLLGHPNLLGDYLVVSLILAGGVVFRAYAEPALAPEPRWYVLLTKALMGVLAVACAMAVTTAWVGLGLAMAIVGLVRWSRERRGRQAEAGSSRGRTGLWRFGVVGLLGAALGLGTAWGALRPMALEVGSVTVESTGVRPTIWRHAAFAFRTSPLRGVGAAPFLAEAAEPTDPEGVPILWDAHSTPLSILGQFGIVGFGLYLWLIIEIAGVGDRLRRRKAHRASLPRAPLLSAPWDPLKAAVFLALLAAASHALVTASEDFRHLWLLVGLFGLINRHPLGLVQHGDSA